MMKIKSILGTLSTCVFMFGLVSTADATLISRLSGQAYYDTDADLTWSANANINGTMNWAVANTWASTLTIGGVGGWRLPTTLQPDASCGGQSSGVSFRFNCTGSEMGNLFYNVLGGSAGSSITTTHNSNYDLFSNVQSNLYWSATEYAPNPNFAWLFIMASGSQNSGNKANSYYAWAVQSGDVSAVPEPGAVWLLGIGLIGLMASARRKR